MLNQHGTSSSYPTKDQGRGNKRPRTAAMYNRKRAVTACQSCRLRKTKCDNVRPACGFCSRNGAQCVYPGSGTDSDYSSYDPASLTILDRLNHVVSLLESRPSAVLVNDGTSPQLVEERDRLSGVASSGSQPLRVFPMGTSCQTIAQPPEEDILQVLDRPGFLSSSNNCESIMKWPILEELVPDINSFVLESNEDVQAGHNNTRVSSLGKGVREEDFLPLSKLFLTYAHVKNPILDVKDYKNKVKEVAENGPGWDGTSCLVPGFTSIGPALISETFFGQAARRSQISQYHRKHVGLNNDCIGPVSKQSSGELRYEIPLPPSGITQCDYPDMFPSPPTELTPPSAYDWGGMTESEIVPEEEKSWFYYLAEISYRRMMNRFIAIMAGSGEQGWINDIPRTMKQCKEFNEQLDLW
ncbi:vegetative cell wall gp1 [Fusarium beomiforme]|uniref:Vegetative cell wall gp1 n=1 Tax=Fusarium beomiforme TaxID=44412 RepID=A0A9P5API5_9HYPO|nr:vegetative cell wall gp1 [Fusarium beomiforme]